MLQDSTILYTISKTPFLFILLFRLLGDLGRVYDFGLQATQSWTQNGEAKVSDREGAKGTKKVLKIHKFYNQKYQEQEITIVKEELQAQDD